MAEKSPVEKVQELLKLPQELCYMCGKCCRIATFKGGLSYENILELIDDPKTEPSQVDGAKDFLSIFIPYKTHAEARKYANEFVNRAIEEVGHDKLSFFYCKYISDENHCLIHEDRPLLCRMYPIPHSKTLYNPGCGFEKLGKENWDKIQQIIKDLQNKNV